MIMHFTGSVVFQCYENSHYYVDHATYHYFRGDKRTIDLGSKQVSYTKAMNDILIHNYSSSPNKHVHKSIFPQKCGGVNKKMKILHTCLNFTHAKKILGHFCALKL